MKVWLGVVIISRLCRFLRCLRLFEGHKSESLQRTGKLKLPSPLVLWMHVPFEMTTCVHVTFDSVAAHFCPLKEPSTFSGHRIRERNKFDHGMGHRTS